MLYLLGMEVGGFHSGHTLPGVLEALKLQLPCRAVSQWALMEGGPWDRHIAQSA